MNTRETIAERPQYDIGRVIWDQIEPGVKMALGARDCVALDRGAHFTVARRCHGCLIKVRVILNSNDLYDVELLRVQVRGPRMGECATIADRQDVDVASLNPTLLALDELAA